MTGFVPILKDEGSQQKVPSIWRADLSKIVESLKDLDFAVESRVPRALPISPQRVAQMTRSLANYGARLIGLPEEAWETSACQWMRSYWDVVVDLFTAEEGPSDLVLLVRVFEHKSEFSYEILSLHVP